MDNIEVAYEIAGYQKRLRELTRIARYNAWLILRHMDGKKAFLSNPTKLGKLSDENENTGNRWKKTTLEGAKEAEKFWKERDKQRKLKEEKNGIDRYYQNPIGP